MRPRQRRSQWLAEEAEAARLEGRLEVASWLLRRSTVALRPEPSGAPLSK